MDKFSNFFLMLKQGIKGVFHFRVQFLIILILSFIATFILSVSFSTQRRMNNSYNEIVKKVDRFDYQGNLQFDSTVSDDTDAFLISNILNNADFLSLENYQKDMNNQEVLVGEKNAYNYVFSDSSDAYEGHENFFTKLTANPEFQKIFIYAGNYQNPTVDPDKIVADPLGLTPSDSDVWYQVYQALFIELFTELDQLSSGNNLNNNLIYSVVGRYTTQNPGWFSRYLEYTEQQITGWKDANQLLALGVGVDDIAIFNNVQTALIKIISWMKTAVDTLLLPLLPAEQKEQLTFSDVYAFLFGIKLEGTSEITKDEWIVSDKTKAYSINISNQNDTPLENYVFLNNDPDNPNVNLALSKQGFRGILNPVVYTKRGNNPTIRFEELNPLNFYNGLILISGDDTLFNVLSVFGNFHQAYVFTPYDITTAFVHREHTRDKSEKEVSKNPGLPERETIYYAYQLMLARASGFDFGIRREATLFDATHQVKYRGIILNSHENYNTTVLHGRGPAAGQEIGISEQFARKQKIKVGSVIKAGDALYTVAGLMTDAFSFVPSQDLQNPIPNPKVSTFAYGSEATMKAMMEGTQTSDSAKDSVTQNYSYFLWNQKNRATNTLVARKDLFLASTQDKMDGLKNGFVNVKSYVDHNRLLNDDSSTKINLTPFKESSFRYSWTLEPLVFKIYSAITYTAAGIIAIIAIVALVVCVRKTIDLNSKQIGILKSLGESPAHIAFSYISYSIIILVAVIPLAWISGILLQIPFANMFLTYFSAQPYIILWDWVSIVIAIFALGVLSGIVAFITAYSLTSRPVVNILVSSVKWGDSAFLDWIKKLNSQAKFSTRFSLTLSSSGSSQIRLMVIVVLVTSILMTFGLAIPSVAITTNNSYYKSIKYANSYTQVPLTANAPQSKNVISFWEGQDYLENDYVNGNLPLDTTGNTYGYYKDPESYSSTISGASVLVPYLFDGKNVQHSYPYIIKNNNQLLAMMTGMFGNNFFIDNGQSFTVGMIDKFFGTVLHAYSDLTKTINPEETKTWTDEQKILFSQNFSNWLTSSIPNIIAAIVNSNSSNEGGSNGEGSQTWKDDIMNVIYKAIPSYVKAYVQKSPSRQDQYAISYQNDLYAPGIDTYTTLVDGRTDRQNDLTLTGLDRVQNSIVIDDTAKSKAYLPTNIKEGVYDVLANKDLSRDLWYQDVQIYNKATNTLTLPMIINKQAESSYKLKKTNTLTNWTNDAQKINFLTTEGYRELPKEAWIYDDTDYVKISKLTQKSSQFFADLNRYEKSADEKYYLDPYELDNNKFTLKVQYDLDNGSLRPLTYLFNDWKYNARQQPNGSYIRPYYVYKNLKMMIPMNLIADLDNFLYPNGPQTKDGKGNQSWYNDRFDAENVPQSVKAAYQAQGYSDETVDGQWLVVNPYDISYYDPEIYANSVKASGSELTNLLIGPGYWYRWVTAGARPPLLMVRSPQTYLNKNLKINLQTVGTIESYNDKLVVIDSDLANSLLSYSNVRTYQYNYQIFDKKSLIPANSRGPDNSISKFDRYTLTNLEKLVDNDNLANAYWQPASYEMTGSPYDYAPHRWYNAKLSNFEEPVNFTSQISFTRLDRWGQFSIKLGGSTGGGMSIIDDSRLLSESKALVKQISWLAIAIGAMLIVALIITASLLIMLTGDIYIAQYMRFMVLLKALGYSNSRIIGYTFGTVSILSAIAWVGGTIIAWVLIFIGVRILANNGLALPAGITWWPIVISLIIMILSYVGSLWLSSRKTRLESPSVILTETAE